MAYNITTAARRRKETLARARTLAVICYLAYRSILWAVRILWHCFRAVSNLVLWLFSVAFWTIVNLARIIL